MSKLATVIADETNIRYFTSLGFTDFNLHLIDYKKTPQEIKRIISASNINVRSIHVPFSDSDRVLIENIDKHNSIKYTAEIAELLYKDEPIYVVCHTQMGRTAADNPIILYTLVNSIDNLLAAYPKIIIAIENTMIFNSDLRSISQGALPDYTDMIRSLRSFSKFPDRICSVLDVCHAQSTVYTIKKIFPHWKINVEEYFSVNRDICKLYHFSNALGHGYFNTTHGIGFDSNYDEDKDRLQYYIKLYEKYIPTALFVYEISETDYKNRDEFANTIKLMELCGINVI